MERRRRTSRCVHDRHGARGRGRRREDLGEAQPPLLADGAPFDVDPGEAEDQRRGRFDRPGRRGGRLGQDLPAPRELGLAGTVGQEAKVSDADEPAGDDMEQEAANELLGVQRHHLHAVAVGVVLPAEAHAPVVEAEEPVVGEGHAVGVAAEVLEDLLGAGEGPLGVHDPVGLPELIEPRREGVGLGEGGGRSGEGERALREGAPEGVEVLAPEDLGEGADGEEKSRRGGDPARPIGGEGAPRDDTVQMNVLREVLPPGVQDRRAAEVTAEVARIAAKGGERGGDGVEEQGVARNGDFRLSIAAPPS